MQAAVILLCREIDKARTSLAKAQEDQRHVSYTSAIERKIIELERAIDWIKWGDSQRVALAKLQTLVEYGEDNGPDPCVPNRRRASKRIT